MSPELKDLLLKVFYYFTSITAITGAIIYIAKISIKFYIDNKVEKYKSNLSKELEKFKSELKLIEIVSPPFLQQFKTKQIMHFFSI